MRSLIALTIAITLGAAACAESPPEVPLRADGTPDTELEIGRQIYTESCKSCHGADGERRSGSNLADLDVGDDPTEFDRLIDMVANGRRRMPAYSSVLTEQQIIAVVRYSVEVL